MTYATRKRVKIGPGGRVETQDPDLPEGASAEIIILLDEGSAEEQELPALSSMIGAGKGLYDSPEDADDYLRGLRNEWD